MSNVLPHHPRFFDSEGLRTACARLRQNGEVDPVQVRADAQTLLREMEACLYWAEGMARRERLKEKGLAEFDEFVRALCRAADLPDVIYIDPPFLTREQLEAWKKWRPVLELETRFRKHLFVDPRKEEATHD